MGACCATGGNDPNNVDIDIKNNDGEKYIDFDDNNTGGK